MAVLLSVEESVDGTYFIVQRVGGDAITTPGKYLRLFKDNVEISPSILFGASDDLDIGIVILATSFGLTTFEDGIYAIQVRDSDNITILGDVTEGFASIVAGQVMRNSLDYRVGLDYKTRYTLLEQIRLLNNLSYSATLGSIQDFNTNLETLERLL